MAQLIPLPLTISCFSKIQIRFTFLVVAYPVVPEKGPLNGCVCVTYLLTYPCSYCDRHTINPQMLMQLLMLLLLSWL